jgi:hypothetical protein
MLIGILSLAICVLANSVVAQTLEEPGWGFKFQVPRGWNAKKQSSGALLGHDRIPGLIMVLPHSAANIQEMRREMGEGLQEEGLQLGTTGDLQLFGKNALVGTCEGFADGQPVKGRVFGAIASGGGGAYVIAITTPEKYGHELGESAESIVRGIQFTRLESSDLMRHFAGTWVNSTTSTETRVTMKSNGDFLEGYESSYGGRSNDQYGNQDLAWGTAGQQQSTGRWTVRGSREKGVITVVWKSGKRVDVEYRVHVEKGQTYWNEYWFSGKLYGRSR